jgi:hypothetical protein
MRRFWMASAAAAAMTVAAGAQAGTYIPVPMVPGAVSETVFSINNNNVVAGSFRDASNVEHGFFGPLDGSNWTVFDFPGEGTTGTEPRYINDHGAITGFATNQDFKVGKEFYRTPEGVFSVFEKDSRPLDGVAQGINNHGTSVGDYISDGGKTVGYIGKKGEYRKDFKLHLHDTKNFLRISPRALTDIGNVFVGLFVDQGGVQHGFLEETLGGGDNPTFAIDYPHAAGTTLQDINDPLTASGQWTDSDGHTHAFIIDVSNNADMKVTDLDPDDGSLDQQAWGINDRGLVAISTSIGKSYIYCPKKNSAKCSVDGNKIKTQATSLSSQDLLARIPDKWFVRYTDVAVP